MNSKKIMIPCR